MIPTFTEIEQSIGGRPKKSNNKKIRKSFYLNEEEDKRLEALAEKEDVPLSRYIRELISKEIEKCSQF